MSAQVAADLRAAADLIEQDGWAQGLYVTKDGCRCADGALMDACKGSLFAAEMVLAMHIGGINSYHIHEWNDAKGRTAAEVITALRAAADKAEQA